MDAKVRQTLEIIESGNLLSMLKGENGFQIPDRNGDYPTNTEAVIDLVGKAIEAKPELTPKVRAAIMNLALDESLCWMLVDYLWQLRLPSSGSYLSHLLSEDDLGVVSNQLRIFKDRLTASTEWVGKEYSNGLWGEVCRMNQIAAKSGLTLLPEEL